MKKSELRTAFLNAEMAEAKYIGVAIKTEGNKGEEIIINPKENFDEKQNYYTTAYDEDLALIATKGKKDIRIVSVVYGKTFEDIQWNITEKGTQWKKIITEAVDKSYKKMLKETPPQTEEEKVRCDGIKEAIIGMFVNGSRSAAEAKCIIEHKEDYERIFDCCMNADRNDIEFKKSLVELQKMKNKMNMRGE